MKPNCFKCKHFYITYDKYTPNGCRIYGVKTAGAPSLVVKKANNGSDCLGFEPKKTETEKKIDFKDPRAW